MPITQRAFSEADQLADQVETEHSSLLRFSLPPRHSNSIYMR